MSPTQDKLQRVLGLLRDRTVDNCDYEALKAEVPTPAALADLLAVGAQELNETRGRPKVGVAVLVRRRGGKELLMGLRKGAHGAGMWGLPGGHLEAGETVVQGALRELEEETGLRVPEALATQLDEYTYVDMGSGRSYVTLYVAVDVQDNSEAELKEPDKFAELCWVQKGDGLPAPLFDPLMGLVNKLGSSQRLWSVGRRGGIYVASKTKYAQMWKDLRSSGAPIISTWINEAGQGETADWQDLWDRCIDEAASAAALIFYVEPGEELKGAYAELGAALKAGVPVYWVGSESASVWRHRLVTLCKSLAQAVRAASTVAGAT